MKQVIVGSGGSSSSSSSTTAVEASDTLRSKSFVRVIDLLGEGEWEEVGVGGLKGIYLDDVPIENSDGTINFTGLAVETRNGTLAQSRMNIATTTESASQVGIRMLKNIPIEQAVTAEETDIVRVNVNIPQLTVADTSGNIGGGLVEYKIEWKSSDNEVWNLVVDGSRSYTSNVIANGGTLKTVTGYGGYSVSFVIPADFTFDPNANDGTTYYHPTPYLTQYNINNTGWVTLATGTSNDTSAVVGYDGVTYTGKLVSGQISGLANTDLVQFRITAPTNGFINNITGKYVEGTGVQSILGKSSSAYERQTSFRISGTAPWIVRCTRLTDDSVSAYVNNDTYFAAIVSVIEEKFRYPGSVLVGMQVDAEQFSSIPTRAYKCKMLKVKVPINYDPIARTYTGIWDGSFKIAWTNNPAWCFYDLITNTRYGLGERIPESSVDKWELYSIAQYCDELVRNEAGVAAPRHTCNTIIQTREEAYKMISDFATIFRGVTYWGNGTIVPVQDSPKTANYAFNNTNVVDGLFTYQSSSVQTRFNAVRVTWNNPNDFYRQWVEYVEDADSIERLGYLNETSVIAFACASKAEARRLGKWLLYTNNYETDIVNFTTGNEGGIPRPGDVIQISDTLRSQERRGGRIKSSTINSVVLDKEMLFVAGVVYTFSAIDVAGNLLENTFEHTGTTATIAFDLDFSAELAKDSIFIIADDDIAPQTFKVISVAEKQLHQYDIQAVSHDPAKYAHVEAAEALSPLALPSLTIYGISDIKTEEVLYRDGSSVKSRLDMSWEIPKFASKYIVNIAFEDGTKSTQTIDVPQFSVLNTQKGAYTLSVTVLNILGQQSQTFVKVVEVYGKSVPPSEVISFSVRARNNQAYLSWNPHADLDVIIGGLIVLKHSAKEVGATWEDGILLEQVAGNSTSATVPLLGGTYMAKAVDSSGVYSFDAAFALSDFALIQQRNILATLQEDDTFTGNKTNLVVVDGLLTLEGSMVVDDGGLVDNYPFFDTLDDGVKTSGTYEFSDVIDLGAKSTVGVSASIEAYSADLLTLIDSRLDNIDDWPAIDAGAVNISSTKLYVATTDDDPNSMGATWSNWVEFNIAEYSARGFKFKLELITTDSKYTIFVSKLSVTVDAEDRTDSAENIVCPVAGLAVVFTPAFIDTPAIAIHIDNMEQGDYHEVTSKTSTGFTLKIKDLTGTVVERSIDWIAKGYGYKY